MLDIPLIKIEFKKHLLCFKAFEVIRYKNRDQL